MGQVALEGMEFFAFHGFYDEEQKIGNKYSVDLYVNTDLHAAGASDELDQTVNYVVLYRIVAEQMQVPARLLEHVGHRILDGVMAAFPRVKSVKVAVSASYWRTTRLSAKNGSSSPLILKTTPSRPMEGS